MFGDITTSHHNSNINPLSQPWPWSPPPLGQNWRPLHSAATVSSISEGRGARLTRVVAVVSSGGRRRARHEPRRARRGEHATTRVDLTSALVPRCSGTAWRPWGASGSRARRTDSPGRARRQWFRPADGEWRSTSRGARGEANPRRRACRLNPTSATTRVSTRPTRSDPQIR